MNFAYRNTVRNGFVSRRRSAIVAAFCTLFVSGAFTARTLTADTIVRLNGSTIDDVKIVDAKWDLVQYQVAGGRAQRLAGGDCAALARVGRLVTGRLARLGAYDIRDDWDDIVQDVAIAVMGAYQSGTIDSSPQIQKFIWTTTCGLTTDGRAFCWGSNRNGALGASSSDQCQVAGTIECSLAPVAVETDARFTTLDVGEGFVCGLTTDGQVLCWGLNDEDQCEVP